MQRNNAVGESNALEEMMQQEKAMHKKRRNDGRDTTRGNNTLEKLEDARTQQRERVKDKVELGLRRI